jgi:hypothetical protein
VVGVFELVHMGTVIQNDSDEITLEERSSPWSMDKMEGAKPFSNEEEVELWNQFINQEHIEVEEGLIEMIHNYTNG